jgi:hypothetical protein
MIGMIVGGSLATNKKQPQKLKLDFYSYLPFATGEDLGNSPERYGSIGSALRLRRVGTIKNVEKLD